MRIAALTLDVFFLIGFGLLISLFVAEKKRKRETPVVEAATV